MPKASKTSSTSLKVNWEKRQAAALRRLTHDVVIIGRTGKKSFPEIHCLSSLSNVALANLIVDCFELVFNRRSR